MLTGKYIMPLMIRESRICDMAISHLADQTGIFEEKYKMSSNDFYRLFQEGKAGDEEDMFEWKALVESVNEWKQTKEQLNFFMNDLGRIE